MLPTGEISNQPCYECGQLLAQPWATNGDLMPRTLTTERTKAELKRCIVLESPLTELLELKNEFDGAALQKDLDAVQNKVVDAAEVVEAEVLEAQDGEDGGALRLTLEPLKLESVERSEEEAYEEMLELVQSADGMERLKERLKEQLRMGEVRARSPPRAAPTKLQRKQATGVRVGARQCGDDKHIARPNPLSDSDSDDEKPDEKPKKLQRQLRSAYPAVNLAAAPPGFIHAVRPSTSEVEHMRRLYTKQKAAYDTYAHNQAKARNSTHHLATGRTTGTKTKQLNHAVAQQSQARVAQASSLCQEPSCAYPLRLMCMLMLVCAWPFFCGAGKLIGQHLQRPPRRARAAARPQQQGPTVGLLLQERALPHKGGGAITRR